MSTRNAHELDEEAWDECRSIDAIAHGEMVEFALIDCDAERVADAARAARAGLGSDVQITEFNQEYSDEPVDDIDHSAERVRGGDAFFLNLAGEVEGTAVTVSLGPSDTTVKFSAAKAFPESSDDHDRALTFNRLARFALEVPDAAGAEAMYFGDEGTEVEPRDRVHIWERGDSASSELPSEVHGLFAEYIAVLDRRFAGRRWTSDQALALRTKSSRVYRRRNGFVLKQDTYYCIRLFGANVNEKALDRYAGRADRISSEHGHRLRRTNVIPVMFVASADAVAWTRRYHMNHGQAVDSFAMLIELSTRQLYSKSAASAVLSAFDGYLAFLVGARRLLKF